MNLASNSLLEEGEFECGEIFCHCSTLISGLVSFVGLRVPHPLRVHKKGSLLAPLLVMSQLLFFGLGVITCRQA